MDDIQLTKILTELGTQQTRIFENLREVKDAVFETARNVTQLGVDVAILKNDNLDKRVTDLEKFQSKLVGAIIATNFIWGVVVIVLNFVLK